MIQLLGLAALYLSLATGCGTSSLMVTTVPEGADVSFVNRDGMVTSVGKSPIDLTPANAPGLFSSSGEVRVNKEGFGQQSALVPNLGPLGGAGKIFFPLSQSELPKICQYNSELATEIAKGVADVSSLIQRKRYSDAGSQIQNLIGKFPGIAVLYDLKGNIYYLQRDLTAALEAYKQSNSLNPNNLTTQRMIETLQTLRGGRQ